MPARALRAEASSPRPCLRHSSEQKWLALAIGGHRDLEHERRPEHLAARATRLLHALIEAARTVTGQLFGRERYSASDGRDRAEREGDRARGGAGGARARRSARARQGRTAARARVRGLADRSDALARGDAEGAAGAGGRLHDDRRGRPRRPGGGRARSGSTATGCAWASASPPSCRSRRSSRSRDAVDRAATALGTTPQALGRRQATSR